MVQSIYLRSQARWCLAMSRNCFDLGASEQLRIKANELNERAEKLESAPADLSLH